MRMSIRLTRTWVKLAVSLGAITALSLPAMALSATAGAQPISGTPSYTCPAVGDASGCAWLITVNDDGTATISPESGGTIDDSEDVLVGVINNSDAQVTSIALSGAGKDIFGFDDDGPCSGDYDWISVADGTYCTSLPLYAAMTGRVSDPDDYEGPNNTFSGISSDDTSGTVDFTTALAPAEGTFFGLEEAPSSVLSVGLESDISVTASPVSGVEGNSTGSIPVATFTDAPNSSPATDFSASIYWGDGTPNSAGTVTQPGGPGTTFDVTGSHTYAEEGNYTTTVTVTDANIAINTGFANATATVADAPLTASSTQPTIPNATTNKSFTALVGTFTDGNPSAPLTDYTTGAGGAQINWGDGTPNSAGTVTQPGGTGTTFDVTGTHTYTANGTYTIRVYVKDAGGSTVTIANTVSDYDAVIACTSSPCSGSTEPQNGQTTGASTSSTTGTILLDLNTTPSVGAFTCGDPFRHATLYSFIKSSGLAANGSIDLAITFNNSAAAGPWWVPFAVCYDSPGVPFTNIIGKSVTLGLLPFCPLPRPGHPVVGPCVESIRYSTIIPLPSERGTVTEQLVLSPNDPFSW
ncbi:MAG: hypothetical protein ABSF89_01075 [Acidimicrobiales bacterium]